MVRYPLQFFLLLVMNIHRVVQMFMDQSHAGALEDDGFVSFPHALDAARGATYSQVCIRPLSRAYVVSTGRTTALADIMRRGDTCPSAPCSQIALPVRE